MTAHDERPADLGLGVLGPGQPGQAEQVGVGRQGRGDDVGVGDPPDLGLLEDLEVDRRAGLAERAAVARVDLDGRGGVVGRLDPVDRPGPSGPTEPAAQSRRACHQWRRKARQTSRAESLRRPGGGPSAAASGPTGAAAGRPIKSEAGPGSTGAAVRLAHRGASWQGAARWVEARPARRTRSASTGPGLMRRPASDRRSGPIRWGGPARLRPPSSRSSSSPRVRCSMLRGTVPSPEMGRSGPVMGPIRRDSRDRPRRTAGIAGRRIAPLRVRQSAPRRGSVDKPRNRRPAPAGIGSCAARSAAGRSPAVRDGLRAGGPPRDWPRGEPRPPAVPA